MYFRKMYFEKIDSPKNKFKRIFTYKIIIIAQKIRELEYLESKKNDKMAVKKTGDTFDKKAS